MADTTDVIKCPACGSDMVKIYDSNLGINVDVCVNGCGGIYFDDKEFEIFKNNPENIEDSLDFLMTNNPKKVDETEYRTCPACGSMMIKSYLDGFSRVQVDKCIDCGGIFLDYGELSVLRNPQ